MADSVDPAFCGVWSGSTVCSSLSDPILRVIMVIYKSIYSLCELSYKIIFAKHFIPDINFQCFCHFELMYMLNHCLPYLWKIVLSEIKEFFKLAAIPTQCVEEILVFGLPIESPAKTTIKQLQVTGRSESSMSAYYMLYSEQLVFFPFTLVMLNKLRYHAHF